MDAIITAGGIPAPGDPLYAYTQGGAKALLEMGGKPMIQWVLDAVNQCDFIERVVIIGLPQGVTLQSSHEALYLASTGEMLTNIQAAAEALKRNENPQARAMILASDIPGITAEMLRWFYQQTKDIPGDLFYNAIEKQTMEARFPAANRTYIELADCQVCGGDVTIFRLAIADGERPIWRRLIDARKNPLKQARLIGLGILIPLLLKKLQLKTAERKISRRLRIQGRVFLSPFAELGMDVDKPHQFEILRAELNAS